MQGLLRIRWQGLAVRHVAEWTTPGAKIAQYHEGGRALAKAFTDIGAGCFFTYGVQFLFPQDPFDFVELLAVGGTYPDPGWFTQHFTRILRCNLDRIARSFSGAFLANFGCHDKEP